MCLLNLNVFSLDEGAVIMLLVATLFWSNHYLANENVHISAAFIDNHPFYCLLWLVDHFSWTSKSYAWKLWTFKPGGAITVWRQSPQPRVLFGGMYSSASESYLLGDHLAMVWLWGQASLYCISCDDVNPVPSLPLSTSTNPPGWGIRSECRQAGGLP